MFAVLVAAVCLSVCLSIFLSVSPTDLPIPLVACMHACIESFIFRLFVITRRIKNHVNITSIHNISREKGEASE